MGVIMLRNKNGQSTTRQLINTKSITDYSLQTYDGYNLVFYIVQPTNISVLSQTNVSARIYALMTIIRGIAEVEIICMNNRENFDSNKRFLKERMEDEQNPVIKELLKLDLNFLDRIQVQMATAREFLFVFRLKEENESEIFPYLNRIEKMMKDQGFSVMRAGSEDIKRILAVYFEQNVTTEKFENFDGERWVILND